MPNCSLLYNWLKSKDTTFAVRSQVAENLGVEVETTFECVGRELNDQIVIAGD